MSHASYESDPDALRAHFAIELRRQRTRAALSMDRLAKALGCTPQWISQLEQTVKPVPEQTALDLDTYFKTDGWQENDGLFIRIHRAIQRTGQRRVLLPGFKAYLEHEAKATIIRCFAAQTVPGLLQTEDYARSIMDLSDGAETLDARVAGRLERQKILTRGKPPQLLCVLDEPLLHRPTGGPKVMADQITHLIEMTREPYVQVRVLPYERITPVALMGSFILLGFERAEGLLYTEVGCVSQLIDNKSLASAFDLYFNTIIGEALSQAESIGLMSRIREEYLCTS